MFQLKSHLWPACTLCRLQESFKKHVKYVRGGGGEAPGGAPGGRCPKCRTVAHRLHCGAHFGRWFLLTFVDSSAKSKKMRSPKGVKSENHVKYDTYALFAKAKESLEIFVKYVIFATAEEIREKPVNTRTFSKRKEEKRCLSSRRAS